jgi:mannose-6-phosphate isomerase-like protein (cupin superfamily)
MITLDACLTDFSTTPAQLKTDLASTWISRAANFVTCCAEALPGAHWERAGQPDEYMVFVASGAASVRAGDERAALPQGTLAIVPPGDSRIEMTEAGTLVMLFSSRAQDLADLAGNASHYAGGAPEVAPLTPWPTPADGWRLRTYDVAEHVQPDSNTRVFRSTNLMLNIMTPRQAARDTTKLSPHTHSDFEQGSLALAGGWKHHLRYPWTKDLSQWRDDQHLETGSPSLLVIPPKTLHTSHNVSDGHAWLLDIFAPPRRDFSEKPGMVCNDRDYPMPPRN